MIKPTISAIKTIRSGSNSVTIRFVACSGRQFISERKLFAPIRDKLLYITDGGTVVRTPREILKVHTLPEETWHGMCETVRNELPDCDYFIATPDYCLAEDAGSRMFRWLTDSYGYDIREAADLMKTPVENVIKFTVYHPSSCEEMCAPVFTPTWQSRAKLASAGKEWVDCNALGVSKWTAISFLMEKYQLNADEICCFGDNLNDIEMLKNAGTSYAVSNARPEVIKAAKSTCAPYWESGVLEVLKSFL